MRKTPEAMTVSEAQGLLAAVAGELEGIAARLGRLSASLPRHPDQDAMFDGRIPRDVATDIQATIDYLLQEELKTAIEGLRSASGVAEQELRNRFDDQRRRLGAGGAHSGKEHAGRPADIPS